MFAVCPRLIGALGNTDEQNYSPSLQGNDVGKVFGTSKVGYRGWHILSHPFCGPAVV